MAHSRPNMNPITNPIKELVSKNRNRYRKDGFNLDLTYITPKIIAMGFPASKIEGCYRNHIDDVARMLDRNHKDHYRIYNLCSERTYDQQKFHNRVREYPFDDHNPPRLDLIRPFCEDVEAWLHRHEKNVAAVHCKAGKGRTGTMICCYLLHSRYKAIADEALTYYGSTRTQDQKGVTIPSQMRYVRYYGRLVQEDLAYRRVPLYLTEIQLEPPPMAGNRQVDLYFSIYVNRDRAEPPLKVYKSSPDEMQRGEHAYSVKFKSNIALLEDVKIELHSKSKISKKAKLFQFWFNTFFVDGAGVPLPPPHQHQHPAVGGGGGGGVFGGQGGSHVRPDANGYINNSGGQVIANNRPLMLCLRKNELDIINKKDKQNKLFSADFKITLYFFKQSASNPSDWGMPPLPQTHEQRSSGSSTDTDTDTDSEWDSGESTVL